MIGQKPAQTLSRPLCSQVTLGPARQLLARAPISGGSDFWGRQSVLHFLSSTGLHFKQTFLVVFDFHLFNLLFEKFNKRNIQQIKSKLFNSAAFHYLEDIHYISTILRIQLYLSYTR